MKLIEIFQHSLKLDNEIIANPISSSKGIAFEIFKGKEHVGDIEFSAAQKVKGIDGKFNPIHTVIIDEKFRRQGIYEKMLFKFLELKISDGIVSYPIDQDSGEFKRSVEAESLWKKLVKKGFAKEINPSVYILQK